ncbi:MAG: hypothetical protein M0Z66_01820 [Thermaerobacter sp.]|nr:hypothetical protein [Thermaerobacter sp.]
MRVGCIRDSALNVQRSQRLHGEEHRTAASKRRRRGLAGLDLGVRPAPSLPSFGWAEDFGVPTQLTSGALPPVPRAGRCRHNSLVLYPQTHGRLAVADAASDSEAHGRYHRSLGYQPIVPLRKPPKGGIHRVADILFTDQGVPICDGGHPMRPYGRVGDRQRWICAGEVQGSGVEPHEPCHQPGYRTRSFRPMDSYRLVAGLHRGSRRFRNAYARRAAIERAAIERAAIERAAIERAAIERAVNNPIFSDSGLEHASRVKSRGRHHFDLLVEALILYGRAFIRFDARQTA